MGPGTPDEIAEIVSILSGPEIDRALRPSVPTLASIANRISAEPELLERLFKAAVGEKTNDPSSLLKRVVRIEPALGFSEHGTLVASHILAHGMQTMSDDEKAALLSSINTDPIHFFQLLRLLPIVFSNVSFRADYVVPWIIATRTRIGNDMAQGGFWRSIEQWSLQDPVEGLRGLQMICESELDDDRIAVAATILGNLRVVWERNHPEQTGLEFARGLLASGDVKLRLVFHRSWINTGWNRGLSHQEFSSALERMTDGTSDERAEAFNFLRCLLTQENIKPESLELGLVWLEANANASVSNQSKYWIVNVVHRLFPKDLTNVTSLNRLWQLLVAIQPISVDLKGIWQDIEHIFVAVVQTNQSQFETLLHLLLRANDQAIKHYFGSGNTFQYLYSELTRLGRQDFYAAMFFSASRAERALAFAIFDHMPFEAFPTRILSSLTDNEVALCVYESRLHHLDSSHVARLFIMLRERAEAGGRPLVDFFAPNYCTKLRITREACSTN
jgi:hypothetical protein